MYKKKSKHRKKLQNMQVSSLVTNSVSSLPAAKFVLNKEQDVHKSSEISKKAQCDLCKLSYSAEKELAEHLLSLMHHTKMEDKEENPVHTCTLCCVTSSDMADYRLHISTDSHQKKLSSLRGDTDRKRQGDNRSHISKNKKRKGSHFRFGGSNNTSMPLNDWGRGLWSGGLHSKNSTVHWPRGHVNNKYHMQTQIENAKSNFFRLPQGNQYYEPSGSGSFSDYFKYTRDRFSIPCREGTKQNECDYQDDISDWLKYPNFFNFDSNNNPGAWDEQLLLEQEQFLAGMDGMNFPSKNHTRPWSKAAQIDRWKSANAQERKCTPYVKDIPMPRIRSPRSVISSMAEVHRGLQSKLAIEKRLNMSSKVPNVNQKMYSLDTSILENAKRFCNELREKQEAPQVQLNLLKRDCDIFNKAPLLVQKQQVSHNDTINSKRLQNVKISTSDGTSVLTQQSKNNDLPTIGNESTDKATSQPSGNMLDEIRKSIETNVLKSQEKSQVKSKSSVPSKPKRRSISGSAEPVTTSDRRDVNIGKPSSKPVHVHKPQITKDSIKKIINAPFSRDVRLHLAKMLQSKNELKKASINASRINVQLDGLNDSAIMPQGINVDQSCDVETIMLEDLSENVHLQILDLIGEDVTNQFKVHPEPKNGKISAFNGKVKKLQKSQENIIVLSDDEDLNKTRKQSKKRSKDISNISTSGEEREASKANRKRKLARPTSTTDLVDSSVSDQQDLRTTLLNPGEALEPKGRIKSHTSKSEEEILCPDNDVEIISCSLDKEHKKTKQTFSRKDVSCKAFISNQAYTTSPTSIQKQFSQNKIQPSKVPHDEELSSSITREECSTAVNLPTIERTVPFKKTEKDVSSEMGTKIPDVLISSSVQTDLQSSHIDISDTGVSSSSTQAEIASSSHCKEVIQSSSDSEMPSSSLNTETQQESSPETAMPCSLLLPTSSHEQMPHRLTLPPSTWLKDRTPSTHNCENDQVPASDGTSLPSFSSKNLKVEDTSGEVTVITDDEDNAAISNHLSVITLHSATSASITESSQIMSELLVLSEREEHIKQEKMTLDLRLSRLHKVLEHALVHINIFTEKRRHLHEEEQELSRQRLSLLKGTFPKAASLNQQSNKSDVVDVNRVTLAPTFTSSDHSQTSSTVQSLMQNLAPASTTNSSSDHEQDTSVVASFSRSFAQTSRITSPSSESLQGTSLSKADWLAKFSSYLPHDPRVERLTSQPCQVTSSNAEADNTRNDVQMSCDEGTTVSVSAVRTAGAPKANILTAAPIKYLGTFISSDTCVNGR